MKFKLTKRLHLNYKYHNGDQLLLQLLVVIIKFAGAGMCRGTRILTASTSWQNLTVPSKLQHYSNNTDLCWVISAPHPDANTIIEFEVLDSILGEMECVKNFIRIMDGETCGAKADRLQTICISGQWNVFSTKPQVCIHFKADSAKSYFHAKFRKTTEEKPESPLSSHMRNTVIYIMSITSYLIFTISLRVMCSKRVCCRKRTAVADTENDNNPNAPANSDHPEINRGTNTDRNMPYTISGAMDYPKPPPYSPYKPPPPYTSTVDLRNNPLDSSALVYPASANETVSPHGTTANVVNEQQTRTASSEETVQKEDQIADTSF